MTVILVLLTIFVFMGLDLLVHGHKWSVSKSDVYYTPEIGFTMADGGKKIETKNKETNAQNMA